MDTSDAGSSPADRQFPQSVTGAQANASAGDEDHLAVVPGVALAASTDTATSQPPPPVAPEPQVMARRRPARPDFRIAEQPGFVLHAWPYRETSLIVDVFTRDHGRVALVAKGAKRAHSALRAVLQGFQPLSLSWTGKGEVRTLTRAEWVGGMPPLTGAALLCGFYLNELLVKFCAREDAHAALFDHYLETLGKLAHGMAPGPALRSFERMLLQETGYAVAFDRCVGSRDAVQADVDYVFDPAAGIRPARISDPAAWPVVPGQTLIDMARDDYASARTQMQGKQLMRFLLDYHLHGTPLTTRQILIDLHKL